MDNHLPSQITAGDSITVILDPFLCDYGSELWRYELLLTNGAIVQKFGCNGQSRIHIPYRTTQSLKGTWHWKLTISERNKTADEMTVITAATGALTIADFQAMTVSSSASEADHAKKALAAIEAVLEQSATYEQMQMMVAGRSLMRYDPQKLLQLRDHYRAEIRRLSYMEANPGKVPFGRLTIKGRR
ncbi:hypothetical protein L2750_14510 [Shewanella submarina]|uniref:Uncharacterized protein n=1 Tax=Shewanella submarina TaxID=2016376 RepID=A0ABV7G552_9GAMM|nr:hypothetical protein [Shewanella submarina]MCL1038343.1 hypothetical protein [Shewanella submarina]